MTRDYKTFPRITDKTPRPRHGRSVEASREKIARPTYNGRVRAADWR